MVSVGWGRLKNERIKKCECAFSDLADEMTRWRARVFSCRVALSKPQMRLCSERLDQTAGCAFLSWPNK
jgi:hypothetical protein